MEILCTRSGCPRPQNFFADLDDNATLRAVQQKYCITCGMPLILVGRYLPMALLRQGGFGVAFLARDRYTPAMRRCVVKQFQPSGSLTPTQLEVAQNLFEREGEVLEQLGSHPQIPDLFAFFEITVPSLQAGKQDKFFYLVQELIDGRNLEEVLAEKGKFSQDEVLAIMQEILPVLKFVHENGSIHRDIKPSNIMRHRNGRLYLLDFGAVKKAAAGVPSGKSTGIYSMGFAPIEQMSGGQVYPSTDLYALGVTCIQLLTGKQPTDLFDAYTNQWNWRGDAEVSSRLANVLDRMLLPTPNQRFQSAEEVLATLSFQTPPPVTANPSPPSVTSQTTQVPISQPQPKVSLLTLLGNAGFTGFEAGLLYLALTNLLPSPAISLGLLGMILGGLIFAQLRRLIEGKDLPIIAGITAAIVWFLVRNQLSLELIVAIPILVAAGAIALTALFRLVYKLLSKIL